MREASRGRTWAELNVIFQRDVPFDDARQALLAVGAALADPFATAFLPANRIEAKIAPALLGALASDERVFAIAGAVRYRIGDDNGQAAEYSHVDALRETPYDLSGDGVTVAIFESGKAQASHAEFGGRLTNHAVTPSTPDTAHTTHVAGTIAATGLNPGARGMAPKARIHQFCLQRPYNDCTSDWLVDKDQKLAPLGVVADNNSWSFIIAWSTDDAIALWNGGEDAFGTYDLVLAAPVDQIANDRNVLFVHSAGNNAALPISFQAWFGHWHVGDDGQAVKNKMHCYSTDGSGNDCPAASCNGGCERVRHLPLHPFDTMSITASAKNVVAVGSLRDPTTIAPTSSRGPARDGRVKPDVVALGTGVYSTLSGNRYGVMSGTSMSAPVVTGIAALLTEQWRRTFAGADPTAAQLKALLIAGADDLGNRGPDYTYGFGLVNAKRSVDTILEDAGQGRRIRSLTVTQGATHEIALHLAQTQDVRIVLNWFDPAIPYAGGDPTAAKALVNDLDVSVIDPAGNTLRPYVLDKDRFTEPATPGINTVDNVEMLEIAGAAPGSYRIRVSGTNLAEGAQKAVLVTSVEMGERNPRRRAVRQ